MCNNQTSGIEILSLQKLKGHSVTVEGSHYGYIRYSGGYWVEFPDEDGKTTIAVADSKDLEAAFQDWIS